MKQVLKRGYTAIEMLVVIAIITILASILLPTLGSSQRKANAAKAKAMIESLSTALESYRSTFGAYPPDDDIGGAGRTAASCLYYYTAATYVAAVNSSATISAGPFMSFRNKDLGSNAQQADLDGDGADEDLSTIIDPWGNTYVYEEPGTNNTTSFDLSSNGPDGTASSGDDIGLNNWN